MCEHRNRGDCTDCVVHDRKVTKLLDAARAAVKILETPMVRGIFSNTDALEACEGAIALFEESQ